ncbi:glutaredoxin 2 isoform X1 [Phyllopteryx taeniolatus]|uniref:glutaredoxin 2 isoform X1 n=1 Tax=Phyllopteryx taeniolatus TaxID=161469 RepID=UPI002AD3DDAF|nr:glutaredoxin 2 isoform X1 [Phyllopteryx taeniolatus]
MNIWKFRSEILYLYSILNFTSSCDNLPFPRMGNFASSTTGGSTSTACVKFVHELVSQNCVVIFSKTTCPYCKMAKNVFNEIGASYKVIELDEHNDGRKLQEALAQMTGAKTVPRVFINGNCIGGGSDTKQLHQQGKLVSLINQCAPCCAPSSEGSGSGQFESAK